MAKLRVSTIGFTKTNAKSFFDRIKRSGAKKVLDVRLHNTSQLAGFAKADDLRFFLKEICNADYVHEPLLAPTDQMLKAFKRDNGDWPTYTNRFLDLMADRKIEACLSQEMFQDSCLLCSEATPHHCHRRLVCEYLNDKWNGSLEVMHL